MTDAARGGLTVEERKRLVEVIIDAAARWGWDAARSGVHADFPAPVVTWDAHNRPTLNDPRHARDAGT